MSNSASADKDQISSDGEPIEYGKLIEKNSAELQNIADEFDIFISHASVGEEAFPDEKDFVEALYEILKKEHKKKVYLDLAYNHSYQYSPIMAAAQLSKFGVFICSFRYIKIFFGRRKEPYKRDFDTIVQEIDVFMGKERDFGFRIIPVKFGVKEDVYRKRNPFGQRFKISIEDEEKNDYKKKAAFVAAKIIEKISKLESSKAS